jgi:predicted DNA-binding transcriptional regulator AlpA
MIEPKKRTVSELLTAIAEGNGIVAAAQAELAAYAITGAHSPAVASAPAAAATTATKYLNRKEVAERMGRSEITITRQVARGVFPKPLEHGPREHARWRESDIDALRMARVDAKEVMANLRRQIKADGAGRQPAEQLLVGRFDSTKG